MKNINEMTNKGLYDLAKATLSTMYFNCVIGMNEIQKECWKMYRNIENDPRILTWHKIAALRLAADINDKKFSMFQNGPAFMQLRELHDELDELRKQALGDGYISDKFESRSLIYRDLDLRLKLVVAIK
jgi:hypothetical protein